MSFREEFIELARNIYGQDYIPLHRPVFEGNEKQYLIECIDYLFTRLQKLEENFGSINFENSSCFGKLVLNISPDILAN